MYTDDQKSLIELSLTMVLTVVKPSSKKNQNKFLFHIVKYDGIERKKCYFHRILADIINIILITVT